MCGITGLFSFNEIGRINQMYLVNATQAIESRGPDFQDFYQDHWVGLGHRRLSIIDTSTKGHQPMQDESGRYVIIFNGEIYNYRQLRQELEASGHQFKSESDTEVLLKLFIQRGESCLNQLNGFFAFAIYDNQEQSLFLARDRMGIKPLLYTKDDDRFIFGSEMKSLLAYGIPKTIDKEALITYLQLNYIPHPRTIFQCVYKCPPGHCLTVRAGHLELKPYYQVPKKWHSPNGLNYEEAQQKLVGLLEDSVTSRMVADVPIGAFLSGGIDSSCITALASRHTDQLNTFSIGYQDQPFFDETKYATEVAKKFGTNHQVFSLSNHDLLNHLDAMVSYLDEPFADSSAIPVNILSKETRKYAKVALSGDGADEIFTGYNKHYGLQQSLTGGFSNGLVTAMLPLWRLIPKSRSAPMGNLFRQLERFAMGNQMTAADRYWFWASYNNYQQAAGYLTANYQPDEGQYMAYRDYYLREIGDGCTLNDLLYLDAQLVLPNDMLAKVDLMSMAHGLEVRVPFLDHRVVEFAFSLPVDFKIRGKIRKMILRDAFRNVLPESLYNRPKKGFEVPLLQWFRKELKTDLDRIVFNQETVLEQGVFDWPALKKLRRQLHSGNPGDAHAKTWALYVFQKWWTNYFI